MVVFSYADDGLIRIQFLKGLDHAAKRVSLRAWVFRGEGFFGGGYRFVGCAAAGNGGFVGEAGNCAKQKGNISGKGDME